MTMKCLVWPYGKMNKGIYEMGKVMEIVIWKVMKDYMDLFKEVLMMSIMEVYHDIDIWCLNSRSSPD